MGLKPEINKDKAIEEDASHFKSIKNNHLKTRAFIESKMDVIILVLLYHYKSSRRQ